MNSLYANMHRSAYNVIWNQSDHTPKPIQIAIITKYFSRYPNMTFMILL